MGFDNHLQWNIPIPSPFSGLEWAEQRTLKKFRAHADAVIEIVNTAQPLASAMDTEILPLAGMASRARTRFWTTL